jgi:hypothetical protein
MNWLEIPTYLTEATLALLVILVSIATFLWGRSNELDRQITVDIINDNNWLIPIVLVIFLAPIFYLPQDYFYLSLIVIGLQIFGIVIIARALMECMRWLEDYTGQNHRKHKRIDKITNPLRYKQLQDHDNDQEHEERIHLLNGYWANLDSTFGKNETYEMLGSVKSKIHELLTQRNIAPDNYARFLEQYLTLWQKGHRFISHNDRVHDFKSDLELLTKLYNFNECKNQTIYEVYKFRYFETQATASTGELLRYCIGVSPLKP